MVSAVKYQESGSMIARKNIEVERKPREITIHEIEIRVSPMESVR